MVKVEEVKESNSPYASSDSGASVSTDSLASISTTNSEPAESETLFERLAALVDIVPPKTRASISQKVSSGFGLVKTSGKVVGNVVWIVTTSALLVGLPLALSLEDEAKFVAQEKEILAQQQGQQMLAGTSYYPSGSQGSQHQEGSKGLVPPGF